MITRTHETSGFCPSSIDSTCAPSCAVFRVGVSGIGGHQSRPPLSILFFFGQESEITKLWYQLPSHPLLLSILETFTLPRPLSIIFNSTSKTRSRHLLLWKPANPETPRSQPSTEPKGVSEIGSVVCSIKSISSDVYHHTQISQPWSKRYRYTGFSKGKSDRVSSVPLHLF